MDSFLRVFDAVTRDFSNGRFEDGDRIFLENRDLFPESIKFECSANRHFYRRELQDAIRCYESAIMLSPSRVIPRYQYLVGVQEEREGNLVEAFKRYQEAIESEPEFLDPYVELGGLLVKVEDFEGAAQCYRDAIRIDPASVANHLNLKAVLSRLSSADPERYKVELESVEAACEMVSRENLSQIPANHHW